jgi:hypothetical protein
MSFEHGKKTKVYVNKFDLTCYLNSVEGPAEADTAEVTTFGKDSKVYIPGLKDGTFSAEGFYDGSADAVDEVISEALAEENLVSWYPANDDVGEVGYAGKVINTSHGVASTVDNASNVSVEGQITGGRERVVSLHALGIEEGEDEIEGTAVDSAAATDKGAVGYLHITDITTAGTIQVKIQHSDDNFVADVNDLIEFTATGVATSQRIEVTGDVERYVRAYVNLLANEDITFQVGLHRKL